MASGFSWPCRGFGPPTFKNSWFFEIFKTPAQPSADFGLVDLRKLVVFCDFQIAHTTLCGLWAGRPSKTRGFLRFSNRPHDPLRTLGWSTFENSWFFAIFKSPARPSADFGLVDLRKLVVFCDFQFARATLCGVWAVDLRKLVVFCDFQFARATLCGVWAGQPLKTRGFLQFPNRPRDPLRSFAWLNRSRCGAGRIFLRPQTLNRCRVKFAPERARCELEAVAKPLGSEMLLSTFFIELLLSNFLFKNFVFEAFFAQIRDPVDNSLRLRNAPLLPQRLCCERFGCPMKWELGWVVFSTSNYG